MKDGYVCWDWRKDASPTSIAARGRKASAFRASRGAPENPEFPPQFSEDQYAFRSIPVGGIGDAYG
uniref:Uncharacterized protein n=1 Tax=Magnetococcus massalia (strain MO-1) TaxID=451514 RepID=A0A1S7LPA2_MAGMO|nr:protein of unknown function [Candidatus Magnetococcus massalia]